jgi:hypothetical protein
LGILLSHRQRQIEELQQLVPYLRQKSVHSPLLDGRERHPVDTRSTVILLAIA